MAFDWQSLVDAGLGAARSVAEMQFAKKAMRQQQSLARKMERAGRAGGVLPQLGLGYAATPYTSVGQGFPGGQSFTSGAGLQLPPSFTNSPVGQMLGLGGEPMPGVSGGSSSTAMSPFSGCFKMGPSPATAMRVSPCRELTAVGPDGKQYSWIYRGRPVLYSGDVALAKKVGKLLRKQSRKAGVRFR